MLILKKPISSGRVNSFEWVRSGAKHLLRAYSTFQDLALATETGQVLVEKTKGAANAFKSKRDLCHQVPYR